MEIEQYNVEKIQSENLIKNLITNNSNELLERRILKPTTTDKLLHTIKHNCINAIDQFCNPTICYTLQFIEIQRNKDKLLID